ncbi:hypothetical protein AB0K15_04615 [Amycolatopsis sp. NPDC049253]|uniref:hypothetical protein n=1 Tax=Amycolatopsis sp. NPDC049253 TaxID=3155274 RepID=UPI003444E3F9
MTAQAGSRTYDFDANVAGPVLGIPPLSVPTFDAPELTPLRKPLAGATVGLLVTWRLLPGPEAAGAAQ